MQYNITLQEKRLQQNLFVQIYRLLVLSIKFMKLTRVGCGKLDNTRSSGRPQATA